MLSGFLQKPVAEKLVIRLPVGRPSKVVETNVCRKKRNVGRLTNRVLRVPSPDRGIVISDKYKQFQNYLSCLISILISQLTDQCNPVLGVLLKGVTK